MIAQIFLICSAEASDVPPNFAQLIDKVFIEQKEIILHVHMKYLQAHQ